MEERKISDSLQKVDSNILDWETNSTTVNESDHTGMSSCGIMSCTMIFLSLIIAIVVLVGNAIVIKLLGFQMCRNAFSIYILNLAGADFLFIGFQIGYCFHIIFDIYTIPIKLPLFFIVMLNFAYLCGLSILSAVSIERCLCVMRPFWYRCQLPRHTSAVICTMLWVLSLVLSLSEGKECSFLPGTNISDWCKTIDLIITSWLIVLFVVLLVSSLALVITIFCGLYRIPVTRLYVVIVFTVLFFLLFGLPYGIYWFLLVWAETFYYVFPCGFLPVTIFLSCINSCANPIIYFLVGSVRHHRFQRKSLKLLLQQAMQDTPETEEYVEMGSLGRSREVNSLQGTESCFDQA